MINLMKRTSDGVFILWEQDNPCACVLRRMHATRRAVMTHWLGKYSGLLYALMRIVVGLLFACHGAQKLFGVLGGAHLTSSPQIVAAGIIEFLGGGLIALGLWAGYAGFIASGEMAVAYFTMHAPRGFWPIENNGELAALYCFVFLYIASRGSGAMSFEAMIKRRDLDPDCQT